MRKLVLLSLSLGLGSLFNLNSIQGWWKSSQNFLDLFLIAGFERQKSRGGSELGLIVFDGHFLREVGLWNVFLFLFLRILLLLWDDEVVDELFEIQDFFGHFAEFEDLEFNLFPM